ncbi:MAG: molybdopterin-dependent oxidoreductase, partial [Myxococcales bacterium]|nr:molybdopterin-dependent oxidoreductase [Myxococcales bacterium]
GGFVQGLGWLTTEELVWSLPDATASGSAPAAGAPRRGPAEGALLTTGASTYKLPTLAECPEDFRVAFLPRATEPGVVHGSKAVGEPPLMLAISAREALRAAVAAFAPAASAGAGGPIIELASPATPEAVYWAIDRARRGEQAGACGRPVVNAGRA